MPERYTAPFDIGVFIDRVNYAHTKFQDFQTYFGYILSTGRTGECQVYLRFRGEWLALHHFTDVPEAWLSLYSEYNALVDRAFVVTEPLFSICSAGSGTLPDETDRQIIDFFAAAQDRLYHIGKEAEAMIK